MTRSLLAACALAVLALATPASAQTCTTSWASASNGGWDQSTNWTAGVPDASDTACITIPGTYTVTGPTSAIETESLVIGAASGTQTFAMRGPVRLATGEIRANGVIDWTANYLESGTLTNRGLIRLTGTSSSRGLRGADAVLLNIGTVEWSSTGVVYLYNGARIENTGLWEVTGSARLLGFSGIGTFVNQASGTIRKSTGGLARFAPGVVVENAGFVESLAGTVQFETTATHTDARFEAAAGAIVAFGNGTRFEGTTTGTPQGSVRITTDFTVGDGAVWNMAGTGMDWVSNYLTSGTLTNAGLIRLTGASSSRGIRGADVVLRNESTVESATASPFYVYNGARIENTSLWEDTAGGDLLGFSGVGTFVNEVTGVFRKTGGGTNATRFAPGGLVVENTGLVEALDGAIQFAGTSIHTDARFEATSGAAVAFLGSPHFEGTTTGTPQGAVRMETAFTVGAGAVWNMAGTGLDWTTNYLVAGTLTNIGLIRLTSTNSSRGVRGADAVLRNESTVEWSSTGTFYVYGGGRVENTALWQVTDDGDLLGFTGVGTFANTGTIQKEGPGVMRIAGGGLLVDNQGVIDVRAGEIRVQTQNVHAGATLEVASGALLAFTTPVTFAGLVQGSPVGRIVSSGGIVSEGGTLDLAGTGLEWTGNYLTSGTLTNMGRLALAGAVSSRGVRGEGAVLRNTGTVDLSSTGVLYIYTDGRVENAGQWDIPDGGDILGFSGLGTFVNEISGVLRISNDGTNATRIAGGGLVAENEGTVDIASGTLRADGAFLHREGAVIQGDGTIQVTSQFVAQGDVAPGAPLGSLTWVGPYAPQSSSALQIEIGGTADGAYDQIAVTGAAHLSGRLALDVLGSYAPADGDTFTILTATSVTGGLSPQGLVDTDANVSFYPSVNATSVVLTAMQGIPTITGAISVAPNPVVNEADAQVTVTGRGFAPDVSVQFVCSDCIEPVEFATVEGAVQSISPTEIRVGFATIDAGIVGLYDVVVTDPRGGQAQAPISILPDDLEVTVVAHDATASEQGTDRGSFEIRTSARLAAPLDVRFDLTGTATRYTDYAVTAPRTVVRIQPGRSSARVAIVPLADDQAESDETVVMTLSTDDIDYEIGDASTATITIADGPPPTAFDVVLARPRRAGAGPVSITVSGQGFAADATAQLVCGGTTYDALSAATAPEGTSMGVQFDLTGQGSTTCDLAVTSGADSETLTGALNVAEARPPNLSLELISPERRRGGREVRHRVIVTNRGNVDAYMVPVEIAVNAGATIRPEFAVADPPEAPPVSDFGGFAEVDVQVDVGDQRMLPIVVPVIPAGGEIELTFYSNASSVRAAVLTPLLVDFVPGTTQGRLAPEYHTDVARMASAQFSGSVAACWGRKLGFAAVSTLGGGLTSISGCVRSSGIALAALANQLASAYAGNATTLSYTRVATIYVGALVNCLKAAGANIPWSRGLVLTYNLVTAAYDAYHDCPEKPKETETEEVTSFDPNDKLGPGGVDIERYFRGEQDRLFYTIRFENLATATAPAAEVFVTDTLDVAVFDPATFSLGSVTFGDSTVTPPPNLQSWTTTLDLRPAQPALLVISGSIDDDGILQWSFTTLDPDTNDIPEDPLVGFLPPNQTAPEGEGSVTFAVGLRDGLASGTVVENDARIVFDLNEPIDTPIWANIIDRSDPTSRVESVGLSAASDTTLVLTLSGADDGSGVLNYEVYASRDGGPFEMAFTATGAEALFEAERGSQYQFFSIAQDRAGNQEAPKTAAEASTDRPVDAESPESGLPTELTLADPYPNPTTGRAVIQIGMPTGGEIDVRVYDVQGREVATLADGVVAAGWHALEWDGRGLAAGLYVVRAQTDGEMATQPITVVR